MTEPGAPSITPPPRPPEGFWTTALTPLPCLVALFAFAFIASRLIRKYLRDD